MDERRDDAPVRVLALAAVIGIGLSFVLVTNLYPLLGSGQPYSEPVVGALAWDDYDKTQEWRAFHLLVVAALAGAIGTGRLFRRWRRSRPELAPALEGLAGAAWLPALAWAAAAAVTVSSPPVILLQASGLGALTILMFGEIVASQTGRWTAPQAWQAGVGVLLAPYLAALAAAGGVVIVGKVVAERVVFPPPLMRPLLLAAAASAAAAGLSAVWSSRDPTQARRRLQGLLILAQVPLPLLWFRFASQGYARAGVIDVAHRSAALTAIAAALTGISWVALARRQRRLKDWSGDAGFLRAALSPWALSAAAVYLACLQATAVTALAGDFYHPAEMLLPWPQLADFGKRPWVDYAPLHGLLCIAYGAINELFYGHTAASFPLAVTLLRAGAAALGFTALYAAAGPVLALIAGPFVVQWDRFYLLAPALFLLSSRAATARPSRWLACWLGVAAGVTCCTTGVGLALCLGGVPVGAWMAWRGWRTDRRGIVALALAATAAAAAVLGCRASRETALGFAGFLTGNAQIYTVNHAIGLFQQFADLSLAGLANLPFSWDLVRLAWIPALAAPLLVAIVLRRGKDYASNPWFILACLVPPTFLGFAKYALERLDPPYLTRTGEATNAMFVLLLPPLLTLGLPRGKTVSRLAAVVVGIGVMTGLTGRLAAIGDVVSNPAAHLAVDEVLVDRLPLTATAAPAWLDAGPSRRRLAPVSGQALGLPRLGEGGYAPPIVVDLLLAFQRAVRPYLRPGETFLNLADSSALYFYLNLPVPVYYADLFAAADYASQDIVLRQLRADPPPVVLAAPRIMHDGGPASLRSYRIYRWALDNYVPVEVEGFVLLVRPDRTADGPAPSPAYADRAALLDRAFRETDLKSLPSAWGRSAASLAGRMSVVGGRDGPPDAAHHWTGSAAEGFRPAGPAPAVVYAFGPTTPAPRQVDYLMIVYDCAQRPGDPRPSFDLYFETDREAIGPLTKSHFVGGGRRALLPMGAQPRWRSGEAIVAIRLDLINPQSCRSFRVDRLTFLTLRD